MKVVSKIKVLVAALAAVVSFAAQAKDYTGDISDGVIDFGEIMEDSTITIASGETVTSSTAITGLGSLTISGGGTLVLAAESPNYSGSIIVDEGTLAAGRGTTAAFGTGAIIVNSTGEKVCRIQTNGGSVANAISFTGATSDAHEGFYFDGRAGAETISGNITAAGDLYLKTSTDSVGASDVLVTFTGDITAVSPAKIASAPHFGIEFKGRLSTDNLEGYWAANPRMLDGGNPGYFKVSTGSSPDWPIKKITLDQTCVKLGAALTQTNLVAFTGEHAGRNQSIFDMNNFAATITLENGTPVLPRGTEGCKIINSSSTAKTLMVVVGTVSTYIALDGAIGLSSYGALTIKNRDCFLSSHSLGSSSLTIDANSTLQIPRLEYKSGNRSTSFGSTLDDPMPDVKSVLVGNHKTTWSQQTLDSVSRFARSSFSASCGSTLPRVTLPNADSVLSVASMSSTAHSDASLNRTYEPGIYEIKTLSSDFGGSSVGKIRVIGTREKADAIALTWQGADDADFFAAENWKDAGGDTLEENPAFDDLTKYYAVTIPSGTSAIMSKDVFLSGLTFGADLTGFTFKKSDASASVEFHTFDFEVEEKTNADVARTFVFECPFVRRSTVDRNFAFAANDTFDFAGGLATFASINNNSGKVILRGKCWLGGTQFYTHGGLCDVLDGEIRGTAQFKAYTKNAGSVVTLNNAVFDVTIDMDVDANTREWVHKDGTTTVYNKRVAFGSNTLIVPVKENATVVYKKGIDFYSKTRFSVSEGGFLDIRGSISQGYRDGGYFWFEGAGTALVRDATETQCQNFNLKMTSGKGVVKLCRDNYIKLASALSDVYTKAGKTPEICGRITLESGMLDIGGTHQRCSVLNGDASATIRGDYPSSIDIMRGRIEADEVKANSVSSAWIEGDVSIRMFGAGVHQLTGRAFASCGDLCVTNGTLELAANATWLNGTNFTARGKGTLKFAAEGQVNKTFAQLHVADQGMIYVPEGVRMRFASATLDGEPVDEAIYPTGTEGSTGLSAHITGGGSIRIKRPGTVLVVH